MHLIKTRLLFYALFFPWVVSSIVVYLLIRLSDKINLYDDLGRRKIHTRKILQLGGICLLSAAICTAPVLHWMFGFLRLTPPYCIYNIIAGLFIFLIGLLDDIANLHANVNLSAQCMDRINGRVGVLSISILISYTILAQHEGILVPIIYCIIILIATICGFLLFSLAYPTAKIFMGDCGSQTLGFACAILPLLPKQNDHELTGTALRCSLRNITGFSYFCSNLAQTQQQNLVEKETSPIYTIN